MFTLITGLLAKKYLIETGDKDGRDGGDQGVEEGGDQGVGEGGDQGDYLLTGKLQMKEYGQVDDMIFFVLI